MLTPSLLGEPLTAQVVRSSPLSCGTFNGKFAGRESRHEWQVSDTCSVSHWAVTLSPNSPFTKPRTLQASWAKRPRTGLHRPACMPHVRLPKAG